MKGFSMKYRINGFDQIKAFYSIVFKQDHDIKPQHVSLYVFLINQNNRNNWVEWFKCPYDLAMAGACIGSKKTYYKCLHDLKEWGLIDYKKGANEWKAPQIKLEVLKCTSTYTSSVPQGEPLPTPLGIPLPEPLPIQRYKLVTKNIKLITDNLEIVLEFLKKPKDESKNNLYSDFINKFNEITGKKIRVPDLKFKKQLNARLKEGFTVEEIYQAIEACKKDPYHLENPNYLSPEFITRLDKLQKFMNTQKPKQNGNNKQSTGYSNDIWDEQNS